MKSLLSLVYAARGVAVLVFLLSPKTATTMFIFAAVMGVTFCRRCRHRQFGRQILRPANMATLFGIVMLSHQIGGFLGAWLGGKVFTMTGSYDTIWIIDILLAFGAGAGAFSDQGGGVAAEGAIGVVPSLS